MPSTQIVLASASPRRRALLDQIGVNVHIVAADIDESLIAGETAEQHVIRLSKAKAEEIAARCEVVGRWFIGSDTIVVRNGKILGKPANPEEATSMLRSLAGHDHTVVSGYAVHDRFSGCTLCGAVITRVWIKPLTEHEIAGYLATGEPLDKAGGYAIQGIGAFMVSRIEGSYSNVVGLPLCEVLAALEQLGAPQLFP